MKQTMLFVFTIAVCGCATIAPTPNALLELRLADTRPGPGLSEMAFPGSSQPVFLSNVPVIRNADIVYAQVTIYSDAPAVAITFTKTGEIKFCSCGWETGQCSHYPREVLRRDGREGDHHR